MQSVLENINGVKWGQGYHVFRTKRVGKCERNARRDTNPPQSRFPVFPRAAESDVPLVVVACMARLRRPGGEKRYSKTCDENQPFGDHNPYVYRRVCSFKRFRKPALLCDQVQNFYSLILYVHALLLTAWPS